MTFIYIWRVLSLAYLTITVQDVIANEDDWISIKKEDLCPAIHKEAICTDKLIDFDEVASAIRLLGKLNILTEKQTDTGKEAAKCGEPLRKALCSPDAKPLCLEEKNSGDESAAIRVCDEFYRNCPTIEDPIGLRRSEYLKQCAKYLRREFSDMTCVNVGNDIEDGICPMPTRKMPEFYIQIYEAKSVAMKPLTDLLDKANDILDNLWNPECLRTVRELPCTPIYCTDDGKSVQMKNKRKECNRAMECVSQVTKKLNTLTASLLESWVNKLRDAVKDSCETVIEGVEDLLKSSENNSALTGGASAVQYSIIFTLFAVLLCLKML